MINNENTISIGRRKASVARVKVSKGKGKLIINKREPLDYFKRKSLETIPFEKGSGTAAMAPAQQDLNRIKTALSIILKNPTAIKDLLSPEEKKALKTILAERDKK